MARAAPPTLPPLLPAGTFRSHIAGRSPARWTGPQRASQFPFDVTEALYEVRSCPGSAAGPWHCWGGDHTSPNGTGYGSPTKNRHHPICCTIPQATGVPLIDELMAMGTLEAAAQRSARLAGVALAVGMLGTLALRAVARRASSSVAAPGGGFNAFPAAAASALEPLQALLPYGTGVYLLTLGASLAQVAVARRSKQFAFLCCECCAVPRCAVVCCTPLQALCCAVLRHAHALGTLAYGAGTAAAASLLPRPGPTTHAALFNVPLHVQVV